MLIQTDLMGKTTNKVKKTIERMRAFEPPDGYYLAFSGGKDSVVLKALADMAGVKYDAHYNVTTVDPPELTRFIKAEYPDVAWQYPEMTMRQLIIKKMAPPTRIQRYCCEHLKETHGKGRVTMTGVRWAESANRSNNQGLVTIIDKRTNNENLAAAERFGACFRITARGGIVLNLDNAGERRTVEFCYRTSKTLVNPIIDWTDDDIWEFIHGESVPYCDLYNRGCKRIGCVGCPLGGYASMIYETEVLWPQFRKFYINVFGEMLIARQKAGKRCKTTAWETAENLFLWWTGRFLNAPKDQLNIFDDMFEEQEI